MARTEVTGAQIKDQSVSLTADVTGILPVANGGTGSNTLALNSLLLGNGTGALQAVAPGTSGNVLTSNGTTWVSAPPTGEVTLTGTQTLSNKTISGGILSGATVVPKTGSVTIYNTVDQVTNYEQAAAYWTGNTFYLESVAGGTGTRRAMVLQNGGGALTVNPSSNVNGGVSISYATGSPSVTGLGVLGTLLASSGVQYSATVAPTLTQTGTAGYTALLINPTETTTGSGTKKLIDAQVGGVSRFQVDNAGNVTAGNTTSVTTATPLSINLGATYGNNTAGSAGNLKLRLYDTGVPSSAIGFGVSAGRLEYQLSAGASHTFYIGGTERFTISPSVVTVAGVDVVTTSGSQTLTNKVLTTPQIGAINDTGGQTALVFTPTASVANYLQAAAGAAGIGVSLSATGTDSNINLNLFSKGTGAVNLRGTSIAFQAVPVTSGVNYLAAYSQVTGAAPSLYAVGADVNINLNLQPKGTGVVQAGGVPVVTTTVAQVLTNKTISGSSNTLSNIPISAIAATGTPSSSTYLRGDGSWQSLANSYTVTIGDGAATTITVTHNLGTRDVVPSVFDATTYEVVECDITLSTTNTLTLTFATAPALNALRCVVLSSGSTGLSSLSRSVSTVTSSTTLGAAPSTDYIVFVGAGGAPTLPTAVGNTNCYTIKNTHTDDRTVLTTSSQTIDGAANLVIKPTESFNLISDGANWRIV